MTSTTDPLIRRLQDLEDREALRELKARYFRHVDAKQWDALAELFAPDAKIEATTTAASGVDGFIASLRALAGETVTFHAGHMPELTVHDDGTASGRWAMSFHMEWPADADRRGAQGYRRYEDEFRKSEGRWRITRMRILAIPADPLAVRAAALSATPAPQSPR